MAPTARSAVGTEFYHVVCMNNSIVIVQLVKILRSKVTEWTDKIYSCFPAYYYSTLISKDIKNIPQTHMTTHFTQVSAGDWHMIGCNQDLSHKQSMAIPWFSHWFLTKEACVHTQASPCRICREQSGTGKGICPKYFRFHPSISIHQWPIFIPLPLTLHNLSNWVLLNTTLKTETWYMMSIFKYSPSSRVKKINLVNWPAQFYSQNHVTTLSARRSTATIKYQCRAWRNDITPAFVI
jgi:hypothetical protein